MDPLGLQTGNRSNEQKKLLPSRMGARVLATDARVLAAKARIRNTRRVIVQSRELLVKARESLDASKQLHVNMRRALATRT